MIMQRHAVDTAGHSEIALRDHGAQQEDARTTAEHRRARTAPRSHLQPPRAHAQAIETIIELQLQTFE